MYLRLFARALSVTALALVGAAASAQPAQQIDVNGGIQSKTRIVSARGLDLGTERGREALDARLKVAANAVCDVWDVSEARPHGGFATCRDAALRDARARAQGASAGDDISVTAG